MDTFNMEMSILNDELKINMIMDEMTLFNNTILNENSNVILENTVENIKNKFIEIWNRIVEKIKKIITWIKEKIFKKIDESEDKIKQNIKSNEKDDSMEEMIRHTESRFPSKTGSYEYLHEYYFLPILKRMDTCNKWKNGNINDDEMNNNINQLQRIVDDLKEYNNRLKNGTDDTAIVREYNNRKRKDLIDAIIKINETIKSDSQKIHNDLDQINHHNKAYESMLKDFKGTKVVNMQELKFIQQYLTLLLQSFSLLINTMENQSETNYVNYMYNNMILKALTSGSNMEGENFKYLFDN